ncbi:swi5-like zinc finger protein [Linnemannia exigua]|uniref:Swi5-like zinc finger protein n=1 Tax=Linnemannia exigua TaxID=604196 RepID=A0AAD4H8G5_9FUNG|nr:swi5-like zinc finger protein [Linnemannia exigua]
MHGPGVPPPRPAPPPPPPVATTTETARRETFESDRILHEEQDYRTQDKNREGEREDVYPGVGAMEDRDKEAIHLESPSTVPSQQYPHQYQEQEQEQEMHYRQDEHSFDAEMDTEEQVRAPPVPSTMMGIMDPPTAASRDIAPSSTSDATTTQPESAHPHPEATSSSSISTTTSIAAAASSPAAGFAIAVATSRALDSGKKKRDSKEQQDALKAQEDAKIEQLKKTIADLQQQEQDIIRLLRGVGTPSEMISKHIEQLHEYNEIKDAGQVILGKCAELEGTTIKKQYENFGLDMDD